MIQSTTIDKTKIVYCPYFPKNSYDPTSTAFIVQSYMNLLIIMIYKCHHNPDA